MPLCSYNRCHGQKIAINARYHRVVPGRSVTATVSIQIGGLIYTDLQWLAPNIQITRSPQGEIGGSRDSGLSRPQGTWKTLSDEEAKLRVGYRNKRKGRARPFYAPLLEQLHQQQSGRSAGPSGEEDYDADLEVDPRLGNGNGKGKGRACAVLEDGEGAGEGDMEEDDHISSDKGDRSSVGTSPGGGGGGGTQDDEPSVGTSPASSVGTSPAEYKVKPFACSLDCYLT